MSKRVTAQKTVLERWKGERKKTKREDEQTHAAKKNREKNLQTKQISAEALRATAEAAKKTKEEEEEAECSPAPASFRPSSAPRVAISAESASKVVAVSAAAASAPSSPPSAEASISTLPLLACPSPPPPPLSPKTPRPFTSKTTESEGAIAQAMDSCFLFQEMEPSRRRRVVAAMERRYVEAGDTVIR